MSDDDQPDYKKIEDMLKAGKRLTARKAAEEADCSEGHARTALKWLAENGRAHLIKGSDPHEWTV